MYMFKPADLGGALKRARLRRGVTQVELAQRAQLSAIFIAKVEAGERMPSWDTLARLARPLKIAVRMALVPGRQRR
jgi:transcriptional regulator with XRE-family HTH domain